MIGLRKEVPSFEHEAQAGTGKGRHGNPGGRSEQLGAIKGYEHTLTGPVGLSSSFDSGLSARISSSSWMVIAVFLLGR